MAVPILFKMFVNREIWHIFLFCVGIKSKSLISIVSMELKSIVMREMSEKAFETKNNSEILL